jgi:hypothetical protein
MEKVVVVLKPPAEMSDADGEQEWSRCRWSNLDGARCGGLGHALLRPPA